MVNRLRVGSALETAPLVRPRRSPESSATRHRLWNFGEAPERPGGELAVTFSNEVRIGV